MNDMIEVQSISVSEAQKALIKQTIAPDATDAELELFCYDCVRRGVHPLDRVIHFTKRKGKGGEKRYVPITGIDFLRMKADETGKYAGNDEPIYDEDGTGKYPTRAIVRVHKIVDGQRCEFSATARWQEYYPGDDEIGFMWRKMPFLMLGKCAEALALRKAFPAQLHGLYTPEEMDQAERDNGPPLLTFRAFAHIGKTPKELTTEELCQEQARYSELADDPTNKYRDLNRKLVEAIKAELSTRPVPAVSKGDANLFEGYCARMRAAKDPLVIREEQRLGATDQRLSLDQQTAINDLAVELLARKK